MPRFHLPLLSDSHRGSHPQHPAGWHINFHQMPEIPTHHCQETARKPGYLGPLPVQGTGQAMARIKSDLTFLPVGRVSFRAEKGMPQGGFWTPCIRSQCVLMSAPRGSAKETWCFQVPCEGAREEEQETHTCPVKPWHRRDLCGEMVPSRKGCYEVGGPEGPTPPPHSQGNGPLPCPQRSAFKTKISWLVLGLLWSRCRDLTWPLYLPFFPIAPPAPKRGGDLLCPSPSSSC